MQFKEGGIFLRKLNKNKKPIVNKYCEGKMKRTLKKEWKGIEIVKKEWKEFFKLWFYYFPHITIM